MRAVGVDMSLRLFLEVHEMIRGGFDARLLRFWEERDQGFLRSPLKTVPRSFVGQPRIDSIGSCRAWRLTVLAGVKADDLVGAMLSRACHVICGHVFLYMNNFKDVLDSDVFILLLWPVKCVKCVVVDRCSILLQLEVS